MPVRIDVRYEGDLQCTATHVPSGERLRTDAPPDNRGRGANFSPTDLVAAAMGTCVLTVMGLVARDRNIDLRGVCAQIQKLMSPVPHRHISKLGVEVRMPARLVPAQRRLLERAAHACPVHHSLAADTEVEFTFVYE